MSPWSIVAVAGAPLAVLIVPLVRLVCTRASMPPAPGQPPRSPGPRAIYPGGVTSHVRPRLATLGFGAALAALVLMTAGLLFSGAVAPTGVLDRSEEHTSELQSRGHLVCRLLLEKKK